MEITLDVQPRTETGKGPARRARAAGKVPGVFYGPAADPQPLYVDARQMMQALHTEAGSNVLITFTLNGQTHLAVPREIQRHPVRGNLVHVDFVNIARNVKIHAEVPIHLVGEAHGVKEGGQLDHLFHSVSIEALPAEVPPAIEVDVSPLGIGQHLTVSQLKAPSGVTILNDGDDIVVSVHTKTMLEEPEPEVEVAEGEEGEGEAPEASAEGKESGSGESGSPEA